MKAWEVWGVWSEGLGGVGVRSEGLGGVCV